MTERPREARAAFVIVILAVAAALLPSLGGCGRGARPSPFEYVLNVIGSEDYALSPQAERELERFRAVYQTYAPQNEEGIRQLDQFSDAFKRVRVHYVRPVPDGQLIDAAITGVREMEAKGDPATPEQIVEAALDSMLSSLDPHSSYLNPEEFDQTSISTRGEFGGLGIEVTMEKGVVKVVAPIEGTPAYRAGLKTGDLITHLNGKSIEGKGLMDAVKLMRGPPGTRVRLTVSREGEAPFDVTIVRAIIKVRSVRWRTEGDIGYIRVVRFTEKVEAGIDKAMADIHRELGPRLKGIVLDLRNNPGGLLGQSLILADDFLEQGHIVSVRGRTPSTARVYDAEPGDLADGLPMVVLINGGSASASEIVASALQDQHRAVLMGTRSFGKGTVQTITPLPIEGALRLTTALYYSPSGRAIQARGVEPDIEIRPQQRKKSKKPRREADLPGALPAVGAGEKTAHSSIEEVDCPEVGKKKDRQLGCAIELLHAGSAQKFLASIGRNNAM